MNIIGHRKIFLSFSTALVLASLVSIFIFGLKLGVDFSGGTLWQVRINDQSVKSADVKNFLDKDLKAKGVSVYLSESWFTVRAENINEPEHQRYLEALKARFGGIEELSFQTIGPAVGSELRKKALQAVVLVLLGISLYVSFAFRKVSKPVQSWKYGLVTLITLFHDVIIPLGLFAILGRIYNVEIDINFIVALLVVAGFSVHDTIVVFDRIRENLRIGRQESGWAGLAGIINKSVNETIVRSINTSLTLIIVLLALLFLGPSSLYYFILTVLVGVSVGTYSSIFVASPGLLWVSRLKK